MSGIQPFVKRISEMEGYEKEGVTFLEEADAETLSANYVRVQRGQSTSAGYHDDEEEVYVVTGGKGTIMLADRMREVQAGDMVYIPRNTFHQVTCNSAEPLEYICVANWPDRPAKLQPIHR
ncbi:MAG: Cupin domain [Paenibacillus sp.]|nr:Cupin domain [Paenibacillus sp.]